MIQHRQESPPIASLTLKRWTANNSALSFEENQEAYDLHMLKMGKKFSKKYSTNIYKLNKVSREGKYSGFSLRKRPKIQFAMKYSVQNFVIFFELVIYSLNFQFSALLRSSTGLLTSWQMPRRPPSPTTASTLICSLRPKERRQTK